MAAHSFAGKMKQNKILFGYSTSGEGKRERVADQKPIFHLDCLKKKKRKRKRRKRKKPFTDHTALQTAEPGVELLLGSGSESGLRHAGVGGGRGRREARFTLVSCVYSLDLNCRCSHLKLSTELGVLTAEKRR